MMGVTLSADRPKIASSRSLPATTLVSCHSCARTVACPVCSILSCPLRSLLTCVSVLLLCYRRRRRRIS
jgi:hypothetical protein